MTEQEYQSKIEAALMHRKKYIERLENTVQDLKREKAEYQRKCQYQRSKDFVTVSDACQHGFELRVQQCIKKMEDVEAEHPYKVQGKPDTYSQYNEGWSDCADKMISSIKTEMGHEEEEYIET